MRRTNKNTILVCVLKRAERLQCRLLEGGGNWRASAGGKTAKDAQHTGLDFVHGSIRVGLAGNCQVGLVAVGLLPLVAGCRVLLLVAVVVARVAVLALEAEGGL
jgi:hypothetical protein